VQAAALLGPFICLQTSYSVAFGHSEVGGTNDQRSEASGAGRIVCAVTRDDVERSQTNERCLPSSEAPATEAQHQGGEPMHDAICSRAALQNVSPLESATSSWPSFEQWSKERPTGAGLTWAPEPPPLPTRITHMPGGIKASPQKCAPFVFLSTPLRCPRNVQSLESCRSLTDVWTVQRYQHAIAGQLQRQKEVRYGRSPFHISAPGLSRPLPHLHQRRICRVSLAGDAPASESHVNIESMCAGHPSQWQPFRRRSPVRAKTSGGSFLLTGGCGAGRT
jgi:hypothetical protein